MTFELALPAFLAGIALGLRYRVVILIPAVALVILFAMIVGIARGDGLLSLIMAMVYLGPPFRSAIWLEPTYALRSMTT